MAESVLVGITTRNRADLLPRALASALSQSHEGVSTKVIDDASTDSTPSLRPAYPQVAWERVEVPRGLRENRNILMRSSSADYYVSLDDDAWFLQGDEIALAVGRMAERPRLGAIAFDILSPDSPSEVPRSEPQPRGAFIGCGHLLRLSAVREAGYYVETPGAYGAEEKDLALRLADLDYEIELLPGVHVWHEKAWNDRDNRPLHRSGVCNEMLLTLQRCPSPDVFAVLPWRIFAHFLFWLRNPFYFPAGLRGMADFLRHAPRGYSHRKPVRPSTFRRLRMLTK